MVWWESGEINMLGLRAGRRSKVRYMQRMGIEESSLFVLRLIGRWTEVYLYLEALQ